MNPTLIPPNVFSALTVFVCSNCGAIHTHQTINGVTNFKNTATAIPTQFAIASGNFESVTVICPVCLKIQFKFKKEELV